MTKTWREKSIGEVNGEEFAAACYAATGLREPRDPAQFPAFLVASVLLTAMRGFSDQDLVERFMVNAILGSCNADEETYRPLIESAIGRKLDPGEPRRHSLESLIAERDRRQVARDVFE